MHRHSCSRFGGLVVVLSLFAACPAARAADGHWTGAVDGFYTNASNWAEGAVPGRFYTPNPAGGFTTNDAPCDTAYFGDDLAGNRVTTIDFDGVHSISNLLTVGKTVRYTYGTKSDQFVPIAALGTFSAGETPDTLVATIACRLRTAVDCFEITENKDGTYQTKYGGDTVTIRNNSSEEFVLGEWGWRTTRYAIDPVHKTSSGGNISIGNETGIRWDGTGDIRVTKAKGGGQPNPQTHFSMTGKWILEATYDCRAFTVNNDRGSSAQRQIEIRSGAMLRHPGGYYNFFTTGAPTRLFGDGKLVYSAGYNSGADIKWKCSQFNGIQPLTIECPVEFYWGGTAPTDANGGTSFTPYFTTGGAGTFIFAGPSNSSTGHIWFAHAASTVQADAFGRRGTEGRAGNCDFRLALGSCVRYTGAGETMDRQVLMLNGAYDNLTKSVTHAATLEQAGTGVWRVESPVVIDAASTLTLRSGTAADAVFAVPLADTDGFKLSIVKNGPGTWKFAAANTYTGTTKVDAGTLYVCRGATLGQGPVAVAANAALVFEGAEEGGEALEVACPAVTVSGVGATLRVGKGCTVTLSGCTQSGKGALDIVTEDETAVVKITGQTGGAPEWLTLNGREASFAADGTVERLVLPEVNATPETSSLFEPHIDSVSGVKSYILRRNLLDFHHQSYYFTARSMTDDGRFLLFRTATNEFWSTVSTRRHAYIDFKTDTVRVLKGVVIESPYLDVERDQLWFVDKDGVHRRDLLDDPQKDILVVPLPPELVSVKGGTTRYGTHITLSPDRTLVFMDVRVDQVFRQGVINLKTGGWEEWGQLRFDCNHGQSSPTDPHFAMCAWEYGSYLVQDEMTAEEWAAASIQSSPYTSWTKRPSGHLYPRIWFFRDDCAPWMVRQRITNYATHEVFRPDGTGIIWCSGGVSHMDFATERQSRISPVGAAHAMMTRNGKYLVFDASENGWWRGCDWTVRFWNRDAHRSVYIHNFMSRMAEQENESKLHPDPHPQFVCNDRYVVCTSYGGDVTPVNGRCMCLSVTPVQQLIDLTEQMAEADVSKRIELAGWTAGQPTGVPYEVEVDTRQIENLLKKDGEALLQSQCPQTGREFTSYALEGVVDGVTRSLPVEAIQPSGDYRYGASLRFVPPAGMTKLVLVVDPPGRYEVADSELCANLFDRRNIRDYYPRTAAAAFAPGETPVAAASCPVGEAAGLPVKFELDIMNFALSTWWGSVRLEQFDAAGNALGSVLAAVDVIEDTGLVRDECLKVRKTGRLAPNAATVRLYLEGANEDRTAPQIQLQHLNLRPAYALDPFTPPSPKPPAEEKGTLVVTVESGRTNAFDFAAFGDQLVKNTVTNFIKRGGGTLVVDADLSRYLGDITVEAGTYAYVTNTALGKLADERTCGSVIVRDGAALDACPPATARGNDWGWFNKRILFEGEGPDGRGALVHSGDGNLSRLYFSTNLVMTGDAKVANLGSRTLFQTSGNAPVYLTMRGHTLTVGGRGQVALGNLTVRWPGSIVVEDGASLTLMNPQTCLGGSPANRLSVSAGGTLSFNKVRGDTRWTLDLADSVAVKVLDGTAGSVSTNLTYWEGPVLTGAKPASLSLGKFDLTLRGPVSGSGFLVEGNALTNGRLHLVSAANTFTDGLVARNAEVWLWANGALPSSGGALAITNGVVAFADRDVWYDLPALVADGTVAVRGAAPGTWREGAVKTGAGELAWEPLVGASTLDLRGGRVSFGTGDASRRAIAGLIESSRRDYPNAQQSEVASEMRTKMSVATNCVVRSPAAYYDRNHHLWTDPAPDALETWRCLFSYSGYIWNNSPTNETWSFAGAASVQLRLTVNGEEVFYYTSTSSDSRGNVVVHPGPNRFDVRGYTTAVGKSATTAKPISFNWTKDDFMVGYDPLGRKSPNQSDYLKIIDPGDGSLLTWCLPEEVEEGVTVPPGGEHPISHTPIFGTMRFAAGTGADFAVDKYAVAALEGVPSITGATEGFEVKSWTVPMADVVAGGLLTAEGRLKLGDVYFVDSGSVCQRRLAIATAAGGVSVSAGPIVRGDSSDWRLNLSTDGRTLYARPRIGVEFLVK